MKDHECRTEADDWRSDTWEPGPEYWRERVKNLALEREEIAQKKERIKAQLEFLRQQLERTEHIFTKNESELTEARATMLCLEEHDALKAKVCSGDRAPYDEERLYQLAAQLERTGEYLGKIEAARAFLLCNRLGRESGPLHADRMKIN